MATIWEYSQSKVKYEVRSAGHSRRLYTNGVFHSQYNPDNLFTGGIWDALTLPALFTNHGPKNILVLGVGGGTAIHQLQKLLQPKKIVGVEINPVHLKIAKEFFNLNYDNLDLIKEDAITYVSQQQSTYDFILDDIFLEGHNDPYRPVGQSAEWLRSLDNCLSKNGILVQNYLSNKDASRVLKTENHLLKSCFNSALRLSVPNYDNSVTAFFKTSVSAKCARRNAQLQLKKSFVPGDVRRLRYKIATLF